MQCFMRADGITPVHIASFKGHFDIVEQLLRAKADTELAHRKGNYTPLFSAIGNGHIAIVRLLVKHGAVTTKIWQGKTPLDYALEKGNRDLVIYLTGIHTKKEPFQAQGPAAGPS